MGIYFRTSAKCITLILLYTFLILTFLEPTTKAASLPQENNSRIKRSTSSCFDTLSRCRKNSSCQSAYRNVKRKCTAKTNKCNADPAYLTRCVENIDILKSISFDSKCDCIGFGFKFEKLDKCFRVYNMIFANPCYDRGQHARDEAARLAAVTMRAIVTFTDVKEYDSSTDVQLLDPKDHVNIQSNHDTNIVSSRDEKPTEAKLQNDVTSENRVPDNVLDLTEEELSDIDDLFAIGREQHAADRPSITVLKPQRHNDVETELGDVGEHERANTSEIGRVVAQFMSTSFQTTQSNNDIYDVTDEYDVFVKEIIQPYPPSRSNEHDATTNIFRTCLIAVGSIVLLSTAVGMFYCYNRVKRNKYVPGKFLKKSCHSAIIVKSMCDDNDAQQRTTNRV